MTQKKTSTMLTPAERAVLTSLLAAAGPVSHSHARTLVAHGLIERMPGQPSKSRRVTYRLTSAGLDVAVDQPVTPVVGAAKQSRRAPQHEKFRVGDMDMLFPRAGADSRAQRIKWSNMHAAEVDIRVPESVLGVPAKPSQDALSWMHEQFPLDILDHLWMASQALLSAQLYARAEAAPVPPSEGRLVRLLVAKEGVLRGALLHREMILSRCLDGARDKTRARTVVETLFRAVLHKAGQTHDLAGSALEEIDDDIIVAEVPHGCVAVPPPDGEYQQ